jgi:hypothetical protein
MHFRMKLEIFEWHSVIFSCEFNWCFEFVKMLFVVLSCKRVHDYKALDLFLMNTMLCAELVSIVVSKKESSKYIMCFYISLCSFATFFIFSWPMSASLAAR